MCSRQSSPSLLCVVVGGRISHPTRPGADSESSPHLGLHPSVRGRRLPAVCQVQAADKVGTDLEMLGVLWMGPGCLVV